MTDIQPYTDPTALPTLDDEGTALISRAVEQMQNAHRLANALATTAFVPAHFRGKPDDVAAAIMYGAAIGLDPMASLRSIYVVNGQPGMYARQMVAIAQSKGHAIWTEEASDESVTVAGRRCGSSTVERDTWTYARAQKAGYTSNKKYDTDPQAMLWARAASVVVRRIAADALAGLDTSVEELRVIDSEVVQPQRPKRESAAALLASANPEPAEAEVAEEAAVEPEPEPSITDAQQRKIGTLMRQSSITERADALAYVGTVIGREVASRTELTTTEAGRVIEALEADLAQPAADAAPVADEYEEYVAEKAAAEEEGVES